MSRRRSMAFALLAVCACGSASPTSPTGAAPRTVYVALTGSDRSDGAIASPWLTLRYAVAQLRAGDTLYIRGGTYTGMDNTIDSEVGTVRSGTSWSNAITIAGYPSEAVTIRPARAGNGFGIRLTRSAPQYLIVQDLIIDMVEQAAGGPEGIYLSSGANHNRFERIEVKNSTNFGITFSRNNGNSPFNEILNCIVHDNGAPGGAATNGHGLYISTSDNLIEGNDIYNNQGYGIHLYDDAGPLNVARNTVRKNRLHGNGIHGGTAYAIAIAWGDRNLIHDNVIFGNPGGILVYTNSSHAEVYNNAIHDNTPLEGILIQYATGTTVRDNVVHTNGTDIRDLGTGTVLSNNRDRP